MGDGLTEEEEPPQISQTPYGDTFDRLFPHYLLMGMSASEYWDGECWLKRSYREAYRLKIKNEERIADRNNWYLGAYIRLALQSSLLLVNGFVPNGVEPMEYPDKPFTVQEEEKRDEEARKQKEENQMKYAMALMHARFEEFNRKFEKDKQNQGNKP